MGYDIRIFSGQDNTLGLFHLICHSPCCKNKLVLHKELWLRNRHYDNFFVPGPINKDKQSGFSLTYWRRYCTFFLFFFNIASVYKSVMCRLQPIWRNEKAAMQVDFCRTIFHWTTYSSNLDEISNVRNIFRYFSVQTKSSLLRIFL